MGYKIKGYSLAELRRVRVEDAAFPALFWAVPVGEWPTDELTQLWRHFTAGKSVCRDLGLLLLSGEPMGRPLRASERVDLLTPAAQGLRRAASKRSLLLLGGAYPQPGWGVSVDWERMSESALEHHVGAAVARVQAECPEPFGRFNDGAMRWRQSNSGGDRGGVDGHVVIRLGQALELLEQGSLSELADLLRKCATAGGLPEATRNRLVELRNACLSNADAIAPLLSADLRDQMRASIREIISAQESPRAARTGALEAQWTLGPSFLVYLEASLRLELAGRDSVVSISWDPARMIGWKLWTLSSSSEVLRRHLHDAALQRTDGLDRLPALDGTDRVDGSDFTDYVHFLAVSGAGGVSLPRSTRDVALELVTDLLGRANAEQIATAVEPLAEHSPWHDPRRNWPDKLLDCLGWPSDDRHHTTPLAELHARFSASRATLDVPGAGEQTRKSIESFAKDIVSLCSTLVAEPRVRDLDDLTAFTASETMTRFAHALVDHRDALTGLAEAVLTVGRWTNARVHDKTEADNKPPPTNDVMVVALGRCLELGRDLSLGRMPWHITPAMRQGSQPAVITGEAWSHSEVQPRLLRYLHWDGSDVPREPVIWNPRGNNPVVTDAVLLDR